MSYPALGRGGPLQPGFPVVGGLASGAVGVPPSAVGKSSPVPAELSSADRPRLSQTSPRAFGCIQGASLPPVEPPTHPTPVAANPFAPTIGIQLSKHLNFSLSNVDNYLLSDPTFNSLPPGARSVLGCSATPARMQVDHRHPASTPGAAAAVAAAATGLLSRAAYRLAGFGGLLDVRGRAQLAALAGLGMVVGGSQISHHHHQHHHQYPHQYRPTQHQHPLSLPTAGSQRHLLPAPPIFTLADLHLVLYGYARSRSNNEQQNVTGSTHSLSGLRISELSYGMDRILSGCAPISKTSMALCPDPACIELPEGLELREETFGGAVHYGVFCGSEVIPRSTRYGPFSGKVVNTSEIKSNDDNSFMWEIFKDGRLSHFIDGRGGSGNWMAYVNCARHPLEQNLIAIQMDGQIYYETCCDLRPGVELLVWYDTECYVKFMGIPVGLRDAVSSAAADSGRELAGQETVDDCESSAGYQCERCGKVFAYQYYRDKHLKYTRCVDQGDRKFPCHLCTRSFEKRDRLRIHILHVHEKHRPHKCVVCAKSFSQSSSLNKHMRVHSGERPYKCVYCSKAFTASSILRTHIRQHSGEKPFKCKHCGKPFASHAAHDSHVRRTHSKTASSAAALTCSICRHSFAHAYELEYHLRSHRVEFSAAENHLATYSNDSLSPRDLEKSDEAIDVVAVDRRVARPEIT